MRQGPRLGRVIWQESWRDERCYGICVMKKSEIFWQTYLNLEKEAIEVSKYIFITDEVIKNRNGVSVTENCYTQMETFSPYIADLLVRTCVQIEAVSKELYFDNGGEKARGDSSVLFDDDCLRLIDKLWSTHSKSVLVVAPFFNLTKEEHRILNPTLTPFFCIPCCYHPFRRLACLTGYYKLLFFVGMASSCTLAVRRCLLPPSSDCCTAAV